MFEHSDGLPLSSSTLFPRMFPGHPKPKGEIHVYFYKPGYFFQNYPQILSTSCRFSRKAAETRTIKGVAIPAGCEIAVNIYAVMQDEDFFSEPHKFIPERWGKFFLNSKSMLQICCHLVLIPCGRSYKLRIIGCPE